MSNWAPIESDSSKFVVSETQKLVFLDRFQKEILQRSVIKEAGLKRRLVIGTNACTRLFRCSNPSALIRLLVFSENTDPGATSHLHLMRSECNIPTIVLPGSNASRELGALLRVKQVSVMAFLHTSFNQSSDVDQTNDCDTADAYFQSFLEVVESRLVSSPSESVVSNTNTI